MTKEFPEENFNLEELCTISDQGLTQIPRLFLSGENCCSVFLFVYLQHSFLDTANVACQKFATANFWKVRILWLSFFPKLFDSARIRALSLSTFLCLLPSLQFSAV